MSCTSRVFLVRAGKQGEDEDLALETGIAVIGFREVPTLVDAHSYEDVAKIVDSVFLDDKPRRRGNFTGQLWAFSVSMQVGDTVVLPRKLTSQIALGRVTGAYEYKKVGNESRHTRPVEWVRLDVPRSVFQQDLLHSFGAFLTVCQVTRNDAAKRVAAVMNGQPDPGITSTPSTHAAGDGLGVNLELDEVPDLEQTALDQIVARIQTHFAGHALAGLVAAVLSADGWMTKVSPPGPDGGVDILAGRGSLGLDQPRLCVQVKSQNSPSDVMVYRSLQGSMQSFKADQGLLVCWGGFTKSVLAEARQSHFSVRLWDAGDLVAAIFRTYERLPAEIQADLPLKRVWMMVPEDDEA